MEKTFIFVHVSPNIVSCLQICAIKRRGFQFLFELRIIPPRDTDLFINLFLGPHDDLGDMPPSETLPDPDEWHPQNPICHMRVCDVVRLVAGEGQAAQLAARVPGSG